MGAAASEAKAAAGRAAKRAKGTPASGSSRGAHGAEPAAARAAGDADEGDEDEHPASTEPPIQEELSPKEQAKKAKAIVKAFVQEMVRGKRMEVVLPSGRHVPWGVGLSRELDALKLKAGDELRRVQLVEIVEIITGLNVSGVETPLNELCATLRLESGETITFQFHDLERRDTFVMCLAMFSDRQRQGEDEYDEEEEGEVPVDS